MNLLRRAAAALTAGLLAGAANAQVPVPHPGQPLYRQHCAACHDRSEETHAPTKATLEAMSVQTLNYALTQCQGTTVDAKNMIDQLMAELNVREGVDPSKIPAKLQSPTGANR